MHVYFDNVGGAILDAALFHIAERARVVLCGGISGYNEKEPPPGPRNLMNLVIRRGRMEGFIVIDYAARFGEAAQELAGWVAAGKIAHKEDVQQRHRERAAHVPAPVPRREHWQAAARGWESPSLDG